MFPSHPSSSTGTGAVFLDDLRAPRSAACEALEAASGCCCFRLFERLNILHRNGVLPLPYIRQFYRYRLKNIWANQVIRSNKMEAHPEGWRDLIELSHKLDIAESKGLWENLDGAAA
jgi:hypothetical protein